MQVITGIYYINKSKVFDKYILPGVNTERKVAKQGFVQALTDLCLLEFKLSLKSSFETQSFKPKHKKVIKTV